jgi:hypothetical protein
MPQGESGGESTFQFEAAWLQEDECAGVVEEAWNSAFEEGAMDLKDVVKHVGQKLWLWDKEVLGELKKRIKKAKKDLEKCICGPIDREGVS